MERQHGNVPYKAESQAISLDSQGLSHPDERAIQPNSRQHMKVLCRKGDVWIDVIGTLDTGTENNWISGHVLNRTGPQPRSTISQEIYMDFQGGRFSAIETATICWHAAKSSYINEGEFRVMENGGFDMVIGRLFLESKGIYEFNEKALLFFHRKASKGLTCHHNTILHYTNTKYVRG